DLFCFFVFGAAAQRLAGGTFVSPACSVDDGAPVGGGCRMNEDVILPWLLQRSTIWMALLAALAPAMIANFKHRSVIRWYLYGFACTLVAWPLVTLPTVHAVLLRPRTMSPEARQRQRRADALALLAENSVQSYPTWVAELRRKSPEGVDRRRFVYKEIGSGASIQLVHHPPD